MSEVPHKRVTQQDIARKAGLDRSTVSLALRGSPYIAEETKTKVRAAAAELGYEPDPMLTALAYYRNSHRKKPFHGTLAWLVNADSASDWRKVTMFQETYLGAKERAPTHGYSLEVFKLQSSGLTARRVAHTLRSRNVMGLLVCPQPRPNTELDFPWNAFSAVTFGYSLVRPQLHTVVSAHFRDMLHTLQHIRQLGYRRIGLVYSKTVDIRVSHYYLAAYLADGHLHGNGSAIDAVDPSESELRRWFQRNQPEAIVSAGIGDVTDVLTQAGIQAPRDVAVACLPLPSREGGLAGMFENSRHIGASAVDMLVALVQQGLRGCPEVPHYTHVDGVWVPGASLPSVIVPEGKISPV